MVHSKGKVMLGGCYTIASSKSASSQPFAPPCLQRKAYQTILRIGLVIGASLRLPFRLHSSRHAIDSSTAD
jgi:hypothetical protein